MKRPAAALLTTAVLAGVVQALVTPSAPAAAQNQVHDEAYDLDCDGQRDVVLGNEFAEVNGRTAAGAVAVFYAGSHATVVYDQDTPGISGQAEYNDYFGWTHASLDWTGDGCDDLVVGAPGESIGSTGHAGLILVLPGAPGGLDTAASFTVEQDTPGVPETREENDWFGRSLAASVTSDGQPYLLVGAPGESIGSRQDAGAVWYWRAGAWDHLSQNSPGVAGTAEEGDWFGETLAVGDRYFAVGTPSEEVGYGGMAGMVHVFSNTFANGAPKPLTGFSQDSAGVSGSAETYDGFAQSISIISYRSSSSAPIGALLAVGVPGETVGDGFQKGHGTAHLFTITSAGKYTELTAVKRSTAGVPGPLAESDDFGREVLVGITNGAKVGTPSTVRWLASAQGDWHVFLPTRTPGTGDLLIEPGTYGLPDYNLGYLHGATTNYVYFEKWVGAPAYAMPWHNILYGGETVMHVGPLNWPAW